MTEDYAASVGILNTFTYSLLLVFFSSCDTEEDFRRTACTSLLQHVVETSCQRSDGAEDEKQSISHGDECKITLINRFYS